MTGPTSTKRGPYAKGAAKRSEILEVALDHFAEHGYDKASVREIAREVGLTQAGLLHHFASKESLFFEVLRERDQREEAEYDTSSDVLHSFLASMDHNARVPGLVRLYLTMAIEAADPDHPGHDYFVARYERVRTLLRGAFTDAAATGLRAGLDPDTAARIIIAVADGIQIQWRLDPSTDMTAILQAVIAAVSAPSST